MPAFAVQMKEAQQLAHGWQRYKVAQTETAVDVSSSLYSFLSSSHTFSSPPPILQFIFLCLPTSSTEAVRWWHRDEIIWEDQSTSVRRLPCSPALIIPNKWRTNAARKELSWSLLPDFISNTYCAMITDHCINCFHVHIHTTTISGAKENIFYIFRGNCFYNIKQCKNNNTS